MKIVVTRRISQGFFFAVFLWFCIVTTQGNHWWQLRGWPVNLFLHLDPLTAVGTILTTHTLYAALLWALVPVVLTIILGRFFCGWLCPFGSLHHFVGYLANRKKSAEQKIRLNRYRKAQCVKYFILIFLLIIAAVPTAHSTSLQTALLDPVPLITRSVNLVVFSIIDNLTHTISATKRYYEGALLLLTIFFAAIFLNLFIPRFFCRFICPLGALFAILSRFAIWRIGKTKKQCSDCGLCQRFCEGGCEPASQIRISECVLCFNCLDDCKDNLVSYQTHPSAAGEVSAPDISRRGFLLCLTSGLFALPAIRLAGKLAANWSHKLIRPPGALSETEFLKRCIKCGQCIRICPTNVIQPAGMEMGLETLWTPVMNNRIGTSGCQLNCTACGYICPTSAIRHISISEKLGRNEFAEKGPVRIGTAFVDRSRCLPWAMDKPCIVCEENCPVSPKAIYTRQHFSTIRNGRLSVKHATKTSVEIVENTLPPGSFATGDYYCVIDSTQDNQPRKIIANTAGTIEISPETPWPKPPVSSTDVLVQVCLQKPYVDVEKCIGCGICEHECPVSGKRAIRVTAENETRSTERAFLLKS